MMSFRCPRHGDQGCFVGIEVHVVVSPGAPCPPSMLQGLDRKYCFECWIEWMDANMEPLSEVDGPT